MDKQFFIDESHLVILKKQLGQIWQYSFKGEIWYNIPNAIGIETHPELLTEITEEEANAYIEAVQSMINRLKNQKSKPIHK